MIEFNEEQRDRRFEHYSEIALTLARAEASFLAVGIPCLFPSKSVRALRITDIEPLTEFLKISLVSVSTQSLESYIEDLRQSTAGCKKNSEVSKNLNLRSLTAIERMFWWATVSAILGGLTAGWCLLQQRTNWVAGLYGLGVLGLTAVSLSALISDQHRFTSFANTLLLEVRRRKGIGTGTANSIPLRLDPDPLSE